MNALTDLLGSKTRQIVYGVLALAGLILGAIQVAYITSGAQPEWLDIALAVFAFVGSAVHNLAGSNVTPAAPVALTAPVVQVASKPADPATPPSA